MSYYYYYRVEWVFSLRVKWNSFGTWSPDKRKFGNIDCWVGTCKTKHFLHFFLLRTHLLWGRGLNDTLNTFLQRDELEYEKELKNSFISHLLAVQSKRRQLNLDRKKNKNGEKGSPTGNAQSKVSSIYLFHDLLYLLLKCLLGLSMQ